MFNKTTQLSNWKWIYKSNQHDGLPLCNYFCEMPPPIENPPILNQLWDGLHWQGSLLSYTCSPGNLCFKDFREKLRIWLWLFIKYLYVKWHKFVIFFQDMAFSLPFAVKNGKVFVKCVIDSASNTLNWMYQLADQTWSSALPNCNYLCEKDPLDDPSLYNRTWEKGTLTVGTKAKYNCTGEYKA